MKEPADKFGIINLGFSLPHIASQVLGKLDLLYGNSSLEIDFNLWFRGSKYTTYSASGLPLVFVHVHGIISNESYHPRDATYFFVANPANIQQSPLAVKVFAFLFIQLFTSMLKPKWSALRTKQVGNGLDSERQERLTEPRAVSRVQ